MFSNPPGVRGCPLRWSHPGPRRAQGHSHETRGASQNCAPLELRIVNPQSLALREAETASNRRPTVLGVDAALASTLRNAEAASYSREAPLARPKGMHRTRSTNPSAPARALGTSHVHFATVPRVTRSWQLLFP